MSLAQYLFASLGSPVTESRFQEAIIRYPLDDRTASETVMAFVDLGQVLGTNELPGDGAVGHDEHGDRERITGHIEVPKSLVINERDTWEIDGEIYTTARAEGYDTGPDAQYRGVRIIRTIPRRTQHSLLKETRPVSRR